MKIIDRKVDTDTVPYGRNISVIGIVRAIRRYWYYYLVSIALCLVIGFLYLQFEPKKYTQVASIVINDNHKGDSDRGIDLSAFGITKSRHNIDNEMFILQSHDTMREVVSNLGLNNTLEIIGMFSRIPIYDNSPYDISVLSDENNYFSIDITPIDDNRIVILGKIYTLPDTIHYSGADLIITRNANPIGEYKDEKLTFRHTSIDSQVNDLLQNLRVSLATDNGSVVNISYTDQIQDRADDIINEIIKVYNQNSMSEANNRALMSSSLINERLLLVGDELDFVDENISAFKSANMLTNIDNVSAAYISQSFGNNQRLYDIADRIMVVNKIIGELEPQVEELKPIKISIELENYSIINLIKEYNDKISTITRLETSGNENNPSIINLKGSASDLRSQIYSAIVDYLDLLQRRYDQMVELQSSTQGHLVQSPSQEKYLMTIERQQKVKESIYLFLLQKLEENELSRAFAEGACIIVSSPSTKGASSPSATNVFFLALFIGLLLPTVIIIIKKYTDSKIRVIDDSEHHGLDNLGSIPHVQKITGAESIINMSAVDDANDAFRNVRSELLNKLHGYHNVILISSVNRHCGKSFFALNLSHCLAITGCKVLLIDCDMRNSGLSTLYGTKFGLSDIIWSNYNDNDAVNLIAKQNIDFISVGKIKINPAEIFISKNFTLLIENLKQQYDYIIFDCPDINKGAETSIISALADYIIFVLRYDKSDYSDINKIQKFSNKDKVGLVLNDVS